MINHRKNSLYSVLTWFIASLFYAYHNTIIAALTIASKTLIESLNISTTQYGWLTNMYTIGYASMQIPVGILLDHVSIKRLMAGAILLFALGCFAVSMTTSYTLLLVTRFIMGSAAAFAVLGAFRISAEWFDTQYFATLAGLTVSLGYLGGIIGNQPFVYLYQHYSLPYIFTCLGLFGIGLCISAIAVIKNFTPIENNKMDLKHIKSDLYDISCNKKSLVLIFYAMLIFTPLLVFKDSLGVLFFQSFYNYSVDDAAIIMDVILFASIITAPSLGVISDKIGKRRPILVLTPILLLSVFALILLKIDTIIPGGEIWFTMLLFGMFGSIAWGFLLSYSVFKETHKPSVVSTGLGLMQTVNMLGGIIAVPVITNFIDYLPLFNPSLSTEQTYFYAFLVLPAIVLLALPLLKHIPETNCKQLYD